MIRSGIMKRKNHDVKGNQGDICEIEWVLTEIHRAGTASLSRHGVSGFQS